MSFADISLRQLELFLKVAERGSVSRAASALGIDQPTASRTIKRLESDIGASVFHRNGRGMSLTESGLALQAISDEFLARLGSLHDAIQFSREHPAGELTFSTVAYLGETIVPRLLLAFRKNYPDIKVHLRGGNSGTIQELLLEGQIDLGIIYGDAAPHELFAEHLLVEDMYLVGKRSTAESLGLKAYLSLRDVQGIPLVLPSRHHGLRRSLESHALQLGIDLNVQLTIDTLAPLRALVHQGDLFTILPIGAIADEFHNGDMYTAAISEPSMKFSLSMVFARNRAISPATKAFAKFIREEFKLIR